MPMVTVQVDIDVFDPEHLIEQARTTPFFHHIDLMEAMRLPPNGAFDEALRYVIEAREPLPSCSIFNYRARIHSKH